jgi:diacylglycerol kinase (ATP)
MEHETGKPSIKRRGFARLPHAFAYSVAGLKYGWGEPAFAFEVVLAAIMLPLAFALGNSWIETSLLVATVVLVLIVELLNTAVEAAIDRISEDHHELSKRAKDLGSAAVLLALLLCAGVWLAAIAHKFAL